MSHFFIRAELRVATVRPPFIINMSGDDKWLMIDGNLIYTEGIS